MVTLKVDSLSISFHCVVNTTTLDIWDIIYVVPEGIVRNKTRDIAHQIAKLTQKLHEENRRYVLIGPGMLRIGKWGQSGKVRTAETVQCNCYAQLDDNS